MSTTKIQSLFNQLFSTLNNDLNRLTCKELIMLSCLLLLSLVTNDWYLLMYDTPPPFQMDHWFNMSMTSSNWLTFLISFYRKIFLQVHIIIFNRLVLYRFICLLITFITHNCTLLQYHMKAEISHHL